MKFPTIIPRFLKFLTPYWRKAAHAGFWMALSILLQFPMPLVTMYIIDHVLVEKQIAMLRWICFGLLLIIFLKTVSSLVQSYLFLIIKERVQFNIQIKLFQAIERLSLDFFKSQRTGYLVSRIQSDSVAVNGLLADTILNFCRDIVIFITAIAFIFVLHWKLALISIIVLPFFVLSLTAFSNRLRAISKEAREKYANVAKELRESLSGIYVIQSYVREKYHTRKLLQSLKESMKINIRASVIGSVAGNITALIGSMGPLIVLWYGGGEIIRGHLTLGQFVAFNSFLAYLFGPTQRLVNLNFSVQQTLGAIERIFELLDMKPDIKERANAKVLDTCKGQITFEHAHFSYNGSDSVLTDIHFSIEPGEIVAIVGYSGAGKSTLANLIPRFYDPGSGRVLIDGMDVRDLKLNSLRKNIGIVAQDTFLFSGTVKENIRYGDPRASDEKVIMAAKAANAHDFIVQLPQAYNTEVGERGIKLSGGEKQRLSIARAILKKPKILILDEATSSLDSQSENLIQEALGRLMQGRTTLVIAHRLSTVLSADRIMVLNKGRIEAEGKHNELYQQSGLYKKLFDEQFNYAFNSKFQISPALNVSKERIPAV